MAFFRVDVNFSEVWGVRLGGGLGGFKSLCKIQFLGLCVCFCGSGCSSQRLRKFPDMMLMVCISETCLVQVASSVPGSWGGGSKVLLERLYWLANEEFALWVRHSASIRSVSFPAHFRYLCVLWKQILEHSPWPPGRIHWLQEWQEDTRTRKDRKWWMLLSVPGVGGGSCNLEAVERN